ncbi:MAG: DUF1330 domain-containing protein [Paracoccaceae bacterium]
MTIHVIATMHVTNPDSLAKYRERAGDALSRHGGSVVQASGALAILEGDGEAPNVAALLTFPDEQAARAWIDDPELAEVHALRRNSGQSEVLMLG